jgi:hypothetical protein
MTSLVPNRLLFEFDFPLSYRKTPPKIDGRLAGWTDDELLPPLCMLDGEEPFAPVWACWHESGLFIGTRVLGKRQKLKCDPAGFWKGDNLRLCTDMRDARRNKRASRFCQQFFFLPTGGGKTGDKPVAGSAKINRAREDAPLFGSESLAESAAPTLRAQLKRSLKNQPGAVLQVAARVTSKGYTLEAHIPADCLIGFEQLDLETEPRIGFYYMLEDRDQGQQFLTIGDDLNWHIDPSTWPTAILQK